MSSSLVQDSYHGFAAIGRLQGVITLCVCVCLACSVWSYAVFALEVNKSTTYKDKSKASVYAVVCCITCCMVLCGLLIFYGTQKSKGFAALTGFGSFLDVVT